MCKCRKAEVLNESFFLFLEPSSFLLIKQKFSQKLPLRFLLMSHRLGMFTWLLINQSQAKKNGVAVTGQAKFDSALWSRAVLSEVGLVYEHDEDFFRKENV